MLSRDQFEQLFDTYVDDVTSFLYTYASDSTQVKDWTQEVFIKMWEKRTDIDFDHPGFKSYLLKTARNHALKELRKKTKYNRWLERHLKQLTKIDPPEDPVINPPDVKKAYQDALSEIPVRARKAYLLSRKEGLTYPEIAQVMDISVKTVETHISKALDILRKQLKDFSR